jgi:DNA-binding transcriptional ArsR family regulator
MLDHQPTLDRVFHALADPTRRAIVERLSRGSVSVSEIAEPLDMTLAAVVQHIQVLEQSGVISTRKQGRVRTCQLEPRTLDIVDRWIAQRRSMWQRNLDRLDEILSERQRKS